MFVAVEGFGRLEILVLRGYSSVLDIFDLPEILFFNRKGQRLSEGAGSSVFSLARLWYETAAFEKILRKLPATELTMAAIWGQNGLCDGKCTAFHSSLQ